MALPGKRGLESFDLVAIALRQAGVQVDDIQRRRLGDQQLDRVRARHSSGRRADRRCAKPG